MKKASNYAYLSKRSAPRSQPQPHPQPNQLFGNEKTEMALAYPVIPAPQTEADLNVFVLSFDGMKEAEKNLAGGDPYECKKCGAILNKFSLVVPSS